MTDDDKQAYWRANLALMVTLLSIWFVVSFVFGILLVDVLDQVSLGSFRLGFWFAQQGSIFTFVVLIGIYAWRMDALDARYGLRQGSGAPAPDAPHAAPTGASDGTATSTMTEEVR